jgi:predicted dienelactone hydrolase
MRKAPGALDAVRVPIIAWAGTKDVITPPAQAELLRDLLGHRLPVELRFVEGAGHFSFMNVPPPQTIEPLRDREAFLANLAAELVEFVARVSPGCPPGMRNA